MSDKVEHDVKFWNAHAEKIDKYLGKRMIRWILLRKLCVVLWLQSVETPVKIYLSKMSRYPLWKTKKKCCLIETLVQIREKRQESLLDDEHKQWITWNTLDWIPHNKSINLTVQQVSLCSLSSCLSSHLSISTKDTIPGVVTMDTSPEGLWAKHVRDDGWLCVFVCVHVRENVCANYCPCLLFCFLKFVTCKSFLFVLFLKIVDDFTVFNKWGAVNTFLERL